MNKEKMNVEMTTDGDIIINGRKFIYIKDKIKKIDKISHIDKHIYKEVIEGEEKKYIDIIVTSIGEQVSKEELIKQLLKDTPIRNLKRIAKRIKENKPIKKHNGCLGFKFGDSYLQLIE